MTEALVAIALGALIAIVLVRPHGWGPPLGAAVAVAIAALAGTIHADDAERAATTLWRPFVTLIAIMTMTAAAERVGLLERLASVIEPRTRGPVKRAFRVTFAISAALAAVLSNDAAILLLTPTVIALIRTVYPRRHPKFEVPFAFAVFTAAGVAPLVISNPMNLVVAEHAGIGFNSYAVTMLPIALAGWVVAYAVLARVFRDALSDEAPALGAWPGPPPPLDARATIVLLVVVGVLLAYPIVSYQGGPLWVVAACAAAICLALESRAIAGVTWGVFPFLAGVFVLALGLERTGVVDRLVQLYEGGAPIGTIGVTSALGSAALNNHPMAILNLLALDRADASTTHVLAALVGGDLGPRLLPMGSLAGLLWIATLRRHDVVVRVSTFAKVGALVTIPSLVVSLGLLWLTGCGGDDGGTGGPFPDSSRCARPETGWSAAPDVGLGEVQETATVAVNGKIYVLGGFDGSLGILDTMQIYDTQTCEWSTGPSLPTPMHHANAVEWAGEIIVLGFATGFDFAAHGEVYIFNGQEWIEGTPMPAGTERSSSSVAVVDDLVYVAGGLRGDPVADFSRYSPGSDEWTVLEDLPAPRDHSCGGAIDGNLYVAGGRLGDPESHQPDTFSYHPGLGWTAEAPMLTGRGGTACGVIDDRLIVVGGEGNTDDPSGVFPQVEAYDPVADEWTALADMPTPRHGMGAAAWDGSLYVPGGANQQLFGATATFDVFTP